MSNHLLEQSVPHGAQLIRIVERRHMLHSASAAQNSSGLKSDHIQEVLNNYNCIWNWLYKQILE